MTNDTIDLAIEYIKDLDRSSVQQIINHLTLSSRYVQNSYWRGKERDAKTVEIVRAFEKAAHNLQILIDLVE